MHAEPDKLEKLKKRVESGMYKTIIILIDLSLIDPHTQDFINPHVAASLFLAFLEALPEPILLAKNYHMLMDAASVY